VLAHPASIKPIIIKLNSKPLFTFLINSMIFTPEFRTIEAVG
jgi:hypothetical protein